MAMNAHDYVAERVKRGRAAQAVANGFTQEDVDLLTAAVTYNLTKPEKAAMFADMLVEESGMGIAEDKVAKIYGKVWGAYIQMKDKRSVGLIDDNKETGIQQWAKPMGVVAGIMPVTNAKQMKRILSMSGTVLPTRFKMLLDRFGDDPAAMKQAGVAYAVSQIIDLVANGIHAIHIYSMTKPDVAEQIKSSLSEILV